MEAPAGAFTDDYPSMLPPPLTVDLQNQHSDAGGAQSGKSETTTVSLLSDPAAAAAAPVESEQLTPATPAEQEAQQASPAAVAAPSDPEVPELAPVAPPDASEGPEVLAEYEAYLQRWEEGQTLAQRWHRLAQQGKLVDIEADWEDWQLDQMLVQVRTRTAAALKEQGKAATGFGGPLICSTRLRRGRGEVQEADDSPSEEPRRVRSRRAPSTLQDFHVDAAAANKTPERTPGAIDPAAAAATSSYDPSSYRQQQLMPARVAAAAEPASEESTDEAEHNVAAGAQQQQQQLQGASQPQQQRPPGRRGPLPQQPPKRVVMRVQRSNAAPQQQAQQSRQFNRVITPYNPQLHQAQQMQAQQMMHAIQQEQQQVAAAAAMAGVSPEMLDEFYAMGSRLGAAFGQGEGGPAGGLAQNPAAMAAFMHALYQYGANPSALAQQVTSVMGSNQ